MAERPAGDGFTVVEPRGEGVLGREPVLHRHDDGTGRVRDLACDVVHERDAADTHSTAVEVHHQPGGLALLLVDANRHPGHDLVRDAAELPGHGERRLRRSGHLEDVLHPVAGVGLQPFGHPRIQHAFVDVRILHTDLPRSAVPALTWSLGNIKI